MAFNLFKYINLTVFAISLLIGLYFVHVYQGERRKIMVYPKPDNVDYIQYKDASGTYFKIKQESVKCPTNENDIFRIPAQN